MAASTITSCKKGGDDNGGGGEVTKPIPVITITAQPRDIETYDYDIYDSVAVSASVTEGATLTYQWYENTSAGNSGGEKIAGATKSFYHIPEDLTEGTYYYFCEVGAEGAKSVRSRAATVTVLPAPPEPVITIVRHPQSVSFTEGSIEGSLTIEATVTEGKTLDYNWCRSTSPDGIAVSEITGETEASFTIPTDLSAGEYHFLCKVSADGTTPVYSDVATVTVEPVPVPIITIVTQPVQLPLRRKPGHNAHGLLGSRRASA